MANVSPDNFKDVNFVLDYVGTTSNRNELNDKLRDDNVTVDSLAIIVMLCNELRKLKSNVDSAVASTNAQVESTPQTKTSTQENPSGASKTSGGAIG